jgi:3-oxoadipate enol-lactonase
VPYFTTNDGCKLYYSTYSFESSNPVAIFLSGTTQTTLYWGAQIPIFSKRYRLLLYDARGQGQSDLGSKDINLQLHVDDLKALLAYLLVEKAHLIGISHGARVALAFTEAFPSCVDHLVLCSIGMKTNERSKVIVRSWLEILRLAGLEAMAWAALPTVFGERYLQQHHSLLDNIVKAIVKRNKPQALIAQLEAVMRYPPPAIIGHKSYPSTLVISGTEDPLVETNEVRNLADQCQGRHEELSGIGHSIPAEAPKRFEKLVLEFLSKT